MGGGRLARGAEIWWAGGKTRGVGASMREISRFLAVAPAYGYVFGWFVSVESSVGGKGCLCTVV